METQSPSVPRKGLFLNAGAAFQGSPARSVTAEAEQEGAGHIPSATPAEQLGETAFRIPRGNAMKWLVIFTGIIFFIQGGRIETVGPRLHDLCPSAEYFHLE